MDLTVHHDGRAWRATGAGLEVRGRDWEELDRELQHALAGNGLLRPGRPLQVCLRFDLDTLPRWLRQYGAHYFNRSVTFSAPAADTGGAS